MYLPFMKYPLAISVFFSALLMGIFCYSQEANRFRIEKAVIKNLSPNIAITSVIEDTHGFLWLGTSNGMYRYDGYKTQAWLNKANDSNSLSHNYVLALAQDKDKTIWCGTFGAGLNCIDYKKQILSRIKQNYIGTSFQLIKCILRPQKETGVWVASPAALLKLSAKGVIEKQIQLPDSIAGENGISEMMETANGDLLILTEKDFMLVNTKSGTGKSLLSNTGKLNVSYKFRSFIKTNDGSFILGHQMGIFIVTPSDSTANKYELLQQSFENVSISRILKTSDNQIWIATNKGLFEYNQSRGVISVIASQINDALKLYEDSKKVLWVATSKNGLYRISKPPFIFHTITTLPALVKNSGINKILEETDSTWLIATDNNLVRWQKNINRTEIIPTPINAAKKDILSVYVDKRKNIWITTRAYGVYLKKSTALKFEPVLWKHHPQSKPAPGFMIDFFESGATLWAAYYSNFYHYCGLFYYDSSVKHLLQATAFNSKEIQLIPAALSDIKIDSDSSWWVSTWNAGLFKIVKGSDKLSVVRNINISSPPKTKLSLNVLSSLILAKTGDIWMGTIGGGINQYQTVKDTVIHYSLSEGLPSNVIYRLEEDSRGNIWISTDNGICKLDLATGNVISFNNSNGLPFTSFNFLSSLHTKNGLLAFGTVNGNVIYFHPDEIIAKPNSLKTVITEISLGNESISTVSHDNILKQAAYITDTLTLPYNQSSVISVSVSNLNLINPDLYAYSYKLEGFDKNWTIITDRNTITYTNLDPGTYTLLLKNSNHYGVWNEIPDKMVLIIHPPYWRTWWFVLLVIAALASLVYWFFRYRFQQQLKVLQVRNKLHRDLHDDVGATLSSVKAYSEILLTNPDNAVLPGLIKENAHEMIERLEVIAWATNPAHDSFSGLHHQISKWAIPLFHTNNIHLYIDVKGVSEQMVIPGEIRQNIYLIAKEALNNSLKYAQASNCTLQFLLQQGKLIMKVTDNGVGLASLIQGGGNGIKNMKRRAEEMGGTLEINTSSAGTAVILMVPTPFRIPKTWDKKANG